MRYDRLSRQEGAAFVHVSVNLDRSESVFNSVVDIDNLDRSAHFSTTVAAQESIVKSWRLDEGYHSFLIDEQGKITAVDPDATMLAHLK